MPKSSIEKNENIQKLRRISKEMGFDRGDPRDIGVAEAAMSIVADNPDHHVVKQQFEKLNQEINRLVDSRKSGEIGSQEELFAKMGDAYYNLLDTLQAENLTAKGEVAHIHAAQTSAPGPYDLDRNNLMLLDNNVQAALSNLNNRHNIRVAKTKDMSISDKIDLTKVKEGIAENDDLTYIVPISTPGHWVAAIVQKDTLLLYDPNATTINGKLANTVLDELQRKETKYKVKDGGSGAPERDSKGKKIIDKDINGLHIIKYKDASGRHQKDSITCGYRIIEMAKYVVENVEKHRDITTIDHTEILNDFNAKYTDRTHEGIYKTGSKFFEQAKAESETLPKPSASPPRYSAAAGNKKESLSEPAASASKRTGKRKAPGDVTPVVGGDEVAQAVADSKRTKRSKTTSEPDSDSPANSATTSSKRFNRNAAIAADPELKKLQEVVDKSELEILKLKDDSSANKWNTLHKIMRSPIDRFEKSVDSIDITTASSSLITLFNIIGNFFGIFKDAILAKADSRIVDKNISKAKRDVERYKGNFEQRINKKLREIKKLNDPEIQQVLRENGLSGAIKGDQKVPKEVGDTGMQAARNLGKNLRDNNGVAIDDGDAVQADRSFVEGVGGKSNQIDFGSRVSKNNQPPTVKAH